MATSAVTTRETALTTLPDAWRIELFRKQASDDPDAAGLLPAVRELGITGLSKARCGRGFLLSAGLERSVVERIANELLADPVLDDVRLIEPGTAPESAGSDHRILVARRPGVMDPVAVTVERALTRAGLISRGASILVSTFRAWELDGGELRIGEIAITALVLTVEEIFICPLEVEGKREGLAYSAVGKHPFAYVVGESLHAGGPRMGDELHLD